MQVVAYFMLVDDEGIVVDLFFAEFEVEEPEEFTFFEEVCLGTFAVYFEVVFFGIYELVEVEFFEFVITCAI